MPSSIGDWYGPVLLAAVLEQRRGPRHAHADLLVLARGLVVRLLLGLDELALEEGDLLGIVELDHVARASRARAGWSVEITSTCGYHSTITFG